MQNSQLSRNLQIPIHHAMSCVSFCIANGASWVHTQFGRFQNVYVMCDMLLRHKVCTNAFAFRSLFKNQDHLQSSSNQRIELMAWFMLSLNVCCSCSMSSEVNKCTKNMLSRFGLCCSESKVVWPVCQLSHRYLPTPPQDCVTVSLAQEKRFSYRGPYSQVTPITFI
jgi:hypothetical protein